MSTRQPCAMHPESARSHPQRPRRSTRSAPNRATARPLACRNAFIVVDESIRDSANLVAGANRVGWHLKNVNLGRDFQADVVADIATAEGGYPCPECGSR